MLFNHGPGPWQVENNLTRHSVEKVKTKGTLLNNNLGISPTQKHNPPKEADTGSPTQAHTASTNTPTGLRSLHNRRFKMAHCSIHAAATSHGLTIPFV